jgi:hypothetical protein
LWDSGELSVSSVSKELLHPLRLHHIHWKALAAINSRKVTLRHIIDPDPADRVLVGSGFRYGINFPDQTNFNSLGFIIPPQYLSAYF